MNEILNMVSDMFSGIFDWLYEFIFEDVSGFFLDSGRDIFSKFESIVFSGDIIYIVLGLTVFTFIAGLVISLIRG